MRHVSERNWEVKSFHAVLATIQFVLSVVYEPSRSTSIASVYHVVDLGVLLAGGIAVTRLLRIRIAVELGCLSWMGLGGQVFEFAGGDHPQVTRVAWPWLVSLAQ
jgi:hypothetical protein